MYPLLKTVLLLLSSVTFLRGSKAPTPPAKGGDIVYKGQIFEYLVHTIIYMWQSTFCAAILAHCYVMLSQFYYPSSRLPSVICANPSPSLAVLSSLSPFFLGSLILLIAGSGLRMWCYKTLGRYFTFEVAIMKDHQLITSGPYASVRHPSYTGGCAMILATSAIFLGGGYLTECRMGNTSASWLIQLWKIVNAYGIFAVVKRAAIEDAQLQKTFGDKWEAYRISTPYKFIPYIL